MARFLNLIAQMKAFPHSEPFWTPVDETAFPNYRSTVSSPMDLESLESRVRSSADFASGDSASAEARFIELMESIWSNCLLYNADVSTICGQAERCSNHFRRLLAKSMPAGLNASTEPPIILSERRLTSIARALAGLVDNVEHRDILLEYRGVFVEEFGVSGWLAGLKQGLKADPDHLYHLLAGTRISISGLVARLAELLLPVECADFDLPDLLITSGLKPGRDRFAGLQPDDLSRSTLQSIFLRILLYSLELLPADSFPDREAAAARIRSPPARAHLRASYPRAHPVPSHATSRPQGSDDDNAAGNIYSSEGSFVGGSSVRDTLSGSECSEHTASFRASHRSVARGPSTSSRSARDRHRLQRLRAQQETYDPAERVVTMDELTMRLESSNGLIIYDINGGEHRVRVTEGKRRFTVDLICGPSGRRDPRACGVKDLCPNIFPRSRKLFDRFLKEQEDLIQRRLGRELIDLRAQRDVVTRLRDFKEAMLRRIDMVMGPVEKPKPHHITLWAVLLHFLVVTWNCAMTRSDFDLLLHGAGQRWDLEFSGRCQLVDGITFQDIEPAMLFLAFSCPAPKCRAPGMCAACCGFCSATLPGQTSASGKSKAEFDKAYSAWKATASDRTVKAFIADNPSFARKPASQSTVTLLGAYSWMARNQSAIVVPANSR